MKSTHTLYKNPHRSILKETIINGKIAFAPELGAFFRYKGNKLETVQLNKGVHSTWDTYVGDVELFFKETKLDVAADVYNTALDYMHAVEDIKRALENNQKVDTINLISDKDKRNKRILEFAKNNTDHSIHVPSTNENVKFYKCIKGRVDTDCLLEEEGMILNEVCMDYYWKNYRLSQDRHKTALNVARYNIIMAEK